MKRLLRRLAGRALRPILARFATEMPPVHWQLYPGHTPLEAGLIAEFFRRDPPAEPGFIVDRLGVRTDVTVLWDGLATLAGTVVPPPFDADFHAEAIEWIGLLKAVSGARDRFTAMELGAGWGPWLVAGALAARSRGIVDLQLLGVEADPQHFASMIAHFRNNDLDPAAHQLHCAAVGPSDGTARWPRMADPRNDWGRSPASEGTDDATMEVRIMGIAGLLATQPVWDLVHIDVQGSEVEICRAGLAGLQERVRWLVIGTHSRVIEGALIALLRDAGWVLENEKPCRFTFSPTALDLVAMTTLDGTQVWRNPEM